MSNGGEPPKYLNPFYNMLFDLGVTKENILILGAGASVPYGLPTWNNLSRLIKEKVGNDKQSIYSNKKEIIDWVDKVGSGKKYETLDKCIELESVSKEYHLNGHEIEDQIFRVIRDIFKESYKDSDDGWIRILNESILHERRDNLESRIAFINYNYDDVLDKNLLNFEYLPAKKRILKSKDRLGFLSQMSIPVLHPHGHFPFEKGSTHIPRLYKQSNTMKSADKNYIDVVSCYESERHYVKRNGQYPIKIYLLGLGAGLQINLDNIEFANKVSEVHVTVKDTNLKATVVAFLSQKFKIPESEIKVYSTCDDLINACFVN